MPKHLSLAALGALFALTFTVAAVVDPYVEDFTTTTYKDTLNTTAEWDTTAGELKLPPFVPSLVGSCDTPGNAEGVAISGDLVFVADSYAGLHVIDISDPSSPVHVSTCNTPGHAYSVAVSGDLALVANYECGLQVIDISDPSSPVIVGSYDTPGIAYAWCVKVEGDLAFMADQNGGLRVIDISNPSSPVLVGSCDTPGDAVGVVVAGDFAFVADEDSGLQVIDISDPSSPVLTGSYDTPGDAWGVAVAGNLAFVADGSSGLQVIDISDPSSPVLAGSYDTPSCAQGVAVAGDLAFVADQGNGLQMIDISDPSSPVFVGSYDTQNAAWSVAVAGDLVFMTDEYSGLLVVRVRQITSPALAGSYDMSGDEAWGIAVSGDLAFVTDWYRGLLVIDISDPSSPVPAGSYYNTPGHAYGVAVSGDIAFVADHASGLQLIDISDPAGLVLAGSYNTSGEAWDVAVTGDIAFVADHASGLQLIDISDPGSPVLTATCDTPGHALGVAVSGDHAFVADYGSGLQVIDISNPAGPFLAGSYDTPNLAYDVAVSGDLAFVADFNGGLQVIDINDPTSPAFVGSFDAPNVAYSVAVAGDLAFVAWSNSGLQLIDISDPSSPVLAGSCGTPNLARGVAVAGDLAFVADRSGGLQVIQVYQHEVDATSNIGQSLAVDGASDTIPRVRLTSTETAGVAWELSVDAGTNWQAFTPDTAWTQIVVPGDDLLWRTTHTWSRGLNPTVSDLTLEWLNEFGPITSISDIPDDQGGWLRLNFTRSGYDFADEDSLPVTGYQIYRRVDDDRLAKQVREDGAIPFEKEIEGTLSASFGSDAIRILDGREFILGAAGERGEFPAGTWEIVASTFATQQDEYCVVIPTLADSTAEGGIAWSIHFVTTHTTTPSIWFACEPDSGYSVDNIAPGVPTGLLVDHDPNGTCNLSWEESPDEDFQYFRVYRGDSEEFEIGPETMVHETAETSWVDAEGGSDCFYKLTALDHAGNESDPASPDEVTAVEGGGLPAVFALHQNLPNPFNPATTIRFELPSAGAVRLEIYDVAGRRLATLLDGTLDAGIHEAVWRGADDSGQAVGSGLYLYRLSATGKTETRKMLLLK